MARTPKSTDTAAQIRKADADAQKGDSLTINDTVESTPTATELARDNPEIFGAETEGGKGGELDKITPQDRRPEVSILTKDELAAAGVSGVTGNNPVKDSDGNEVAIGTRIMVHTYNPVSGQTASPAFVIGYNTNGGLNARLELVDGARARPVEYGGLRQNAGDVVTDNYWTYPDDGTGKK